MICTRSSRRSTDAPRAAALLLEIEQNLWADAFGIDDLQFPSVDVQQHVRRRRLEDPLSPSDVPRLLELGGGLSRYKRRVGRQGGGRTHTGVPDLNRTGTPRVRLVINRRQAGCLRRLPSTLGEVDDDHVHRPADRRRLLHRDRGLVHRVHHDGQRGDPLAFTSRSPTRRSAQACRLR